MSENNEMNYVKLDVKAICPKNGERYSPNLYKWMTHRGSKHRSWTSRVFRDPDGVLWIGMIDDGIFLIGCRLMSALCNGAKARSFAFPLKQLGRLEEVQDFWGRYTDIGRCAIDTEHNMYFVGDNTRWRISGDRRECLWCGQANQRREMHQETVTRERWVNERHQVT